MTTDEAFALARQMTHDDMIRFVYRLTGYAPDIFAYLYRRLEEAKAVETSLLADLAAEDSRPCGAKGAYGEVCGLPEGHWGLHNDSGGESCA